MINIRTYNIVLATLSRYSYVLILYIQFVMNLTMCVGFILTLMHTLEVSFVLEY